MFKSHIKVRVAKGIIRLNQTKHVKKKFRSKFSVSVPNSKLLHSSDVEKGKWFVGLLECFETNVVKIQRLIQYSTKLKNSRGKY